MSTAALKTSVCKIILDMVFKHLLTEHSALISIVELVHRCRETEAMHRRAYTTK